MKATADSVQVVLDWQAIGGQRLVGTLHMGVARGAPVFSFAYDDGWLRDHRGVALDPGLALLRGRIWPRPDQPNFGIFLDSAPDRWGRGTCKRHPPPAVHPLTAVPAPRQTPELRHSYALKESP